MYLAFCLALMALCVVIFVSAPHIGSLNDALVTHAPGPVQEFYRAMSGGRSWSSSLWVGFYRVGAALLFVLMGVLALRGRA